MRPVGKIQFSLGTLMMAVLAAAAALALYAKVLYHTEVVNQTVWKFDVPSLFLLAITLTALALGSWKAHSSVQILLQITLASVGCPILIWIGEGQHERVIRYWFQGTFAATVVLPLLARRYVKSRLPRGPKRDWWKKTCEAMFFSFLNMLLVTGGALLQAAVYLGATNFLSKPAGP
jgi:carbon starvation protein CstA